MKPKPPAPKRLVVSRFDLPIRIPFLQIIVAALCLDRFHAVGWIWGAFGAAAVVFLVAGLLSRAAESSVRIFGEPADSRLDAEVRRRLAEAERLKTSAEYLQGRAN